MACKRSGMRNLLAMAFSMMVWQGSQATCFAEAGAKHGIDPLLLKAIAKVESSMNPKAINYNSNGSYDMGLMQINSMHLPMLKKSGIQRQHLLNDACVSVMVGSEILAGFVQRYGYTWRAIGAYNAGTAPGRERAREIYVAKISREYWKLTKQQGLAAAAAPFTKK